MALSATFYNSTVLQSVMSMQIAKIKAESMGYSNTVVDIAGLVTGDVTTAITNISAGTLTAVYVACLTNATAATGKISRDQLALIDSLLITASKGVTITAGTAESNSTVTNIILAATAASGAATSAVDDTYNGKYIRTTGTTAVYKIITDYTGTSRIAVCTTTTTAITTTDAYQVFTPSTKVFIIGDVASAETSSHVAWRTLFPTKTYPLIFQLLGGSGTIATGLNGVADGVTTFRQAVIVTRTSGGGSHNTTTLSDTSYFTASALINKFVGIESGTLGVGQVRRITANTVSALTVSPAWVTPTGTVVYTVADNEWLCLAHKYLTLAIPTYLYADDSDTFAIWKKLVDKYGTISKSTTRLDGDLELLKLYIQRGKCIFDAQVKGVVT